MAQIMTWTSAVTTQTGWDGSTDVQSDNNVYEVFDSDNGTYNNNYIEFHLTNVTDPFSSSNHTITIKSYRTGGGATELGTGSLTVRLMQGGTQRAAFSFSPQNDTEGTNQYTLSGAEADSITDYNDLRLRISGSATGGSEGYRLLYVDYAELSIPDLSPPSPPTGVSATDGTYTDKVRVTWNSSVGATSYKVYRNTSSSHSGETTLVTGHGSTTYDDTSAVAGVTYYYWVKATNAAGDSDYSSSNTGYRLLPSVSITPAVASAGANTQSVIVLTGSITLTPSPASTRTVARAPFQLQDVDVDGFFQSLAQSHAYTNYGYRKRDTYFAVDQGNHMLYWLYPTTSSSAFTKQLPRVLISVNAQNENIGLSYPLPLSQTGAHVPLKTKNVFAILNCGALPWRRRQNTVMAISPKTGTSDDTTSDTEINEKRVYFLDSNKWAGHNSNFGNASIYTKFFRPPTDRPNIKTKIDAVRPVFTHGNASNLNMRAKLWTLNSYLHNDNTLALNPSETSSLNNDGTILFNDQRFGIEHCIAIELDTNAGSSSWPPASSYTGGGILGLQIFYTELDRGYM